MIKGSSTRGADRVSVRAVLRGVPAAAQRPPRRRTKALVGWLIYCGVAIGGTAAAFTVRDTLFPALGSAPLRTRCGATTPSPRTRPPSTTRRLSPAPTSSTRRCWSKPTRASPNRRSTTRRFRRCRTKDPAAPSTATDPAPRPGPTRPSTTTPTVVPGPVPRSTTTIPRRPRRPASRTTTIRSPRLRRHPIPTHRHNSCRQQRQGQRWRWRRQRQWRRRQRPDVPVGVDSGLRVRSGVHWPTGPLACGR
jgi:hypothetical protein